LAREKVVDEGGKPTWNGVEALEEVRLQLVTGVFLWPEHTLEPRLFFGAAFYFPAGNRPQLGLLGDGRKRYSLKLRRLLLPALA
jgi:hypothetical protein